MGMSEHAMEIDDGMIDLIIETYIASGVVGIENMDLWGVRENVVDIVRVFAAPLSATTVRSRPPRLQIEGEEAMNALQMMDIVNSSYDEDSLCESFSSIASLSQSRGHSRSPYSVSRSPAPDHAELFRSRS